MTRRRKTHSLQGENAMKTNAQKIAALDALFATLLAKMALEYVRFIGSAR